MKKIEPVFWSLWAQSRRNGLAKNGYPTENPIYRIMKPPEVGNVVSSPPQAISEDEWFKVACIESAVNAHKRRRPVEVACLEIWEGAFVGAPPSRSARVRAWEKPYSAVAKGASRAKKAVERYLDS